MMTEEYTLSDIFKYEGITREYCVLKGNYNLTIQELIHLASLEGEFNIDYAFYLRFKRIHQIKKFIMEKDKGLGNSLSFISDNILNEESVYDSQINQYSFLQKPSIYDILYAAINDRKWDLVFYVYQNECRSLYSLIARTEEEFNDKKKLKNKKFFIIQ